MHGEKGLVYSRYGCVSNQASVAQIYFPLWFPLLHSWKAKAYGINNVHGCTTCIGGFFSYQM